MFAISEVFTSFDVDGSGTLSMSELGHALNLLGIDLTEEELADTYRIDGNVSQFLLSILKFIA